MNDFVIQSVYLQFLLICLARDFDLAKAGKMLRNVRTFVMLNKISLA